MQAWIIHQDKLAAEEKIRLEEEERKLIEEEEEKNRKREETIRIAREQEVFRRKESKRIKTAAREMWKVEEVNYFDFSHFMFHILGQCFLFGLDWIVLFFSLWTKA